MAVTPSDEDGFREIQLNGKQLVFLFMAVTVVLVVTFLTGVLVGRGVRAERAEAAQADALTDAPPTPARAAVETPDGDDPRAVTPPTPSDEPAEPPVAAPRNQPPPASEPSPPALADSRPSPARAAAPAPAVAAVSAPAPASAAVPRSGPAPVASAPPGGPRSGYAVQVAAVNVRSEAETIARRLTGKGYAAYVEVPKNNTAVFRVRVGTFQTRREAQVVADRLKKEEKFKPWVTR